MDFSNPLGVEFGYVALFQQIQDSLLEGLTKKYSLSKSRHRKNLKEFLEHLKVFQGIYSSETKETQIKYLALVNEIITIKKEFGKKFFEAYNEKDQFKSEMANFAVNESLINEFIDGIKDASSNSFWNKNVRPTADIVMSYLCDRVNEHKGEKTKIFEHNYDVFSEDAIPTYGTVVEANADKENILHHSCSRAHRSA